MAESKEIKVAVYCRLANYSPECMEVQKQGAVQFAAEQGCEHGNIRIYADNGANGLDFNRPGFSEMMADIAKDDISMVVTKSITRIGRNLIATGEWICKMRESGIAVKTMDGFCSETVLPQFEVTRRFIAEMRKKQRKPRREGGAWNGA
jgi:DNA invertase Pin-like site-specific DNA recombinase